MYNRDMSKHCGYTSLRYCSFVARGGDGISRVAHWLDSTRAISMIVERSGGWEVVGHQAGLGLTCS